MKIITHGILAFLLLLSCSCKKDVPDMVPVSSGEQVVFDIEKTKSISETTTENLESFIVVATQGVDVKWTATFTKRSDGKFVSDKVWPATDPGWSFYASNVEMTASSSGEQIIVPNGNNTDIVCAYMEAPEFKKVNTLKFKHILGRIVGYEANLLPGYEISSMYISVYTYGTYDMASGTWESTSLFPVRTALVIDGAPQVVDRLCVPSSYDVSLTLRNTSLAVTKSFTLSRAIAAGVKSKIKVTFAAPSDDDWGFDFDDDSSDEEEGKI